MEILLEKTANKEILITISLLHFPITIYYFSPVLIFNTGLYGVINGSFIVLLLLFILSVPFGRIFCSYICLAGGLQECSFPADEGKRYLVQWLKCPVEKDELLLRKDPLVAFITSTRTRTCLASSHS